jgi:hypothetical protein
MVAACNLLQRAGGLLIFGRASTSIAGLRKTDERSEFISDNDKTINVVAAH